MKKITCSVIDRPPSDWGFWRSVVDRKNYINFDKTSFPDNAYFCNILDDQKKDKPEEDNPKEILFDKIEILGRIGSPSADAEVYGIKYKGIEFAMKIMPRIDKDSENKNLKEIQTAREASKYYEYFPITFAYGYCPNSSYYKRTCEPQYLANEIQDYLANEYSPFIPKAIEYNIITNLKNKLNKNKTKRFDADYRNGMSIENLKIKYFVDCENPNTEETENTVQVDFLISELTNSDLGNYMTQNKPVAEWKKILIDILSGIYYLNGLVKKVHPDLHPGNILILNSSDDKEIQTLIHDFGRCYDIDDENISTYKSTLISFCSEFISCSTGDDLIIPREILSIIQNMYNIVLNSDINRNNMKEFYEKKLFPLI